jgi:hypothetical protein
MRPALTHIARSVVLVIGVTLILAAPVAAREPVDPNTLNPPPPASFNATCDRTGSQILCDLAFSDPPLVAEPSAISGEIASGHTTISGQQIRVFGSSGTVLVDVGHLVVNEATGELLKSSGKHAFDDYFINGNTEALAPICDAIT